MKARTFLILLLVCLLDAKFVLAAPGIWIDVPFVAQTKDGCGSASISMIIQYWERKTGQEMPPSANPVKIQAALYSTASGGIRASMVREYFQDAGYRVFAFQGEWDDLKHEIALGRPLIVSLRGSGPLGPLHYVVVVGIDAERNYIYVNDPAQQKMLRISRAGFESEWKPTHNWTLLALPRTSN